MSAPLGAMIYVARVNGNLGVLGVEPKSIPSVVRTSGQEYGYWQNYTPQETAVCLAVEAEHSGIEWKFVGPTLEKWRSKGKLDPCKEEVWRSMEKLIELGKLYRSGRR